MDPPALRRHPYDGNTWRPVRTAWHRERAGHGLVRPPPGPVPWLAGPGLAARRGNHLLCRATVHRPIALPPATLSTIPDHAGRVCTVTVRGDDDVPDRPCGGDSIAIRRHVPHMTVHGSHIAHPGRNWRLSGVSPAHAMGAEGRPSRSMVVWTGSCGGEAGCVRQVVWGGRG